MRTIVLILSLALFASGLAAGDGKLMHCFYFTVIDGATEADWAAFAKATDALPAKIDGLEAVWHGQLRRPFNYLGTDRETVKKLRAGEKNVTGPLTTGQRQWGVCMAMADEAALKAYADHPAHKVWEEAYFKVRKPGTNTFDIIGK